MSIQFQDIMTAFEMASFGMPGTVEVYLCKESGKTYYVSNLIDEQFEPLPENLCDDARYVQIPHKNELDLGKRLVLRFADRHLATDYEEVAEIFRRKGAYARFRRLLERRNKLQQWYDFEAEAQEQALREWCEENALRVVD